MKYTVSILLCMMFATFQSVGQTRFYTLGYANIPFELTGGTEEIMKGDYGVTLATHKFKNNKIMRGFVFSYYQLGSSYESSQSYYTGIDYDYYTLKTTIKVKKISFGYESIRLFGKKEIDDPGALYGTFGYYLHYNMVTADYTSDAPPTYYDPSTQYDPKPYLSPLDLSLKFGIGYQHMIGKQWVVYAEGKAYFSILATAGYEYGIGIRYRGLGKGN